MSESKKTKIFKSALKLLKHNLRDQGFSGFNYISKSGNNYKFDYSHKGSYLVLFVNEKETNKGVSSLVQHLKERIFLGVEND